jgi:hypothetical protein
MAMIETRDGAKLYIKYWGVGDPVSDALANAGYRRIVPHMR